MRFRNVLVLLFLPLCAFTCFDNSKYVIKPTSADKKTIELLNENFNEITKTVDLWAKQNYFHKSECGEELNPLCKMYIRNGLYMSASLNTMSNNVDIMFWGFNTLDKEVEVSLKETLKGNSGWILERK